MDAKDRERIKSNFTELVKVTEWNKEIEGFLEQKSELKKLLASVQSCATEEEKKQKFYQDIQRRGPKAFEYLIDCLLNSGNFGAADVLNKDVGHAVDVKIKLRSNSNKVFSNSIEKKEDKRGIPLGNVRVIEDRKPLVVKVKRATMFMNPENCYPMKSKPRGLVLIIDNEDFEDNSKKRVGSHVDSANLYSLFTQLGFTVEVKRNQKRKEMIDTIHEFSQRLDHGDMCVLAVLSHGYRGVILGTDSLPVPEDWIPKQFNNALSPHLQGKPKFFIFQACRSLNLTQEMPRTVRFQTEER